VDAAGEMLLQGYESTSVSRRIKPRDGTEYPGVENSQDVPMLAESVARRLREKPAVSAYLIRGHGAYGCGKDLEEAERVMEALEHLLLCAIQPLLLGGANT
jgi:methylthioribulose-1-phosphate dehydratase